MQRLPRVLVSPSSVLVQQLRSFRLLPSLYTEAGNESVGSAGAPPTGSGSAAGDSTSPSSYDMVIVGDGPVSSALACSIGCEPSLSHKRVLLLQPQQKEDGAEPSGEVSILLRSSVDLLKRIGVWPEMVEKSVVKPFKSVHIWDACSEAHVVFNHSDLSHDTQREEEEDDLIVHGLHSDDEQKTFDSDDGVMGYVVSNQSLMTSLVENLSSYGNVQLETKARAKVIRKVDSVSNSQVRVMLDNGRNITSNLLVGSDGPHSRVRHLCGFHNVGWSHDQWAFTATVEVKEAGSNSSIWQRLLPSGPITMLPVSDSTSAVMWCTSQEHAKSLASMREPAAVVDAVNAAFFDTLPQGDFIASVSEAVRDTVGIFSPETPPPHQLPPLATNLEGSSRAAVPLALTHAPNYVKDRIVLIGEASHHMHPQTGLSLNLGLGDVTTLTERLLEANSRGDDWGSLNHLLKYETERQRQNVPAMAAVEGFHWLSSSTLSPLILMRSIGFNVANAFQPLREVITKQTWELSGSR